MSRDIRRQNPDGQGVLTHGRNRELKEVAWSQRCHMVSGGLSEILWGFRNS